MSQVLRVNHEKSREIERVREDWTGPKAELPKPFVLVGYDSPFVLGAGEHRPLIVDADGVVFLSGEVVTWCRTGCCASNPRRWSSVWQAANAHSSYVVGPDGGVWDPDKLGPDLDLAELSDPAREGQFREGRSA